MLSFRQWLNETVPFQKIFKDTLTQATPNTTTTKVKKSRRKNRGQSPEALAADNEWHERGRKAFGHLFNHSGLSPELHKKLMSIATTLKPKN